MRFLKANLLDDVVSSYDQTKTTVYGRAHLKTIDGDQAIGPPLNKFVDIFTDTGITPALNAVHLTSNGRLFVCQLEAGGVVLMSLHEVDFATGNITYVGRTQFALPDVAATTHTYRSLKVIDSGTTNWKVFVTTTATVLINGGTFLVNKLDRADFVPGSPATIPFATGNDQKAVYYLQESSNIGVNHLMTASVGSVLDRDNNRLYVHNGVSATHQYYVFNTATAPTYATASVSINDATDVVSDAGHVFNNNDPVVFTSLTGGAGLVAGTTYFVRNVVPGVSYQLSATTGGAAINVTTAGTGSIGRGFGTTGSNFVHKTGNLPALTGVLLATDSEDFAVPGANHAHTGNQGQNCAFFCTSTTLYLVRLSDLTSGATSLPTLYASNALGLATEIIAPTIAQAAWSNVLDYAVFSTGTVLVMKRVINNEIIRIFGGSNNRQLEGVPGNAFELQLNAIAGMDIDTGFIAISTLTAGQRGVLVADLYSDAIFNYSYIITKVISAPLEKMHFITTLDKLYDFTGSLTVYYKTSGFASPLTGWTEIPFASALDAFAASTDEIQFKIAFDTLGLDTSIPAQLCEFIAGVTFKNDISTDWAFSHDNTQSISPAYSAFRRMKAGLSGQHYKFSAYDDSGSLVASARTDVDAASFDYSTNNGTSWTPAAGAPSNTPLTTEVRYKWASPPGVKVTVSFREV